MRYTVDRLEGGIAVCEDEDKAFVGISIEKLPKGIKTGDVLVSEDGKFTVDKSATEKKRAEISALQSKLWG